MKLISQSIFAGALLVSALFLSGCESEPIDPVFTQGQDANPVAKLSVGDTLTVALSGLPEAIEPHVEPIKDDGTITMPDIGPVQAAGKTPGEVESEIYHLYVPRIYTHITVAVSAGDRVYYVSGEVKQPGRELYLGATTVTQAIASAGDFTDFADRTDVWLTRGKHRLKVNCKNAFEDPSKDPLVFPGDKITVGRKIF